MERDNFESQFLCADCMTEMAKFPDKFFDVAIVDPPYGINITGQHKSKGNFTKILGGWVEDHSAVHGGYGKGRHPINGEAINVQAPARSSKCHQNFTIRSMIVRHRTGNTLTSCSEYQKHK